MPAPKGVDKDKWERCVLQVKKQKGADSAYAICSAALEIDKDLGEEAVKEAIDANSHGAVQRSEGGSGSGRARAGSKPHAPKKPHAPSKPKAPKAPKAPNFKKKFTAGESMKLKHNEQLYRIFESQRDKDERLYFPVTIIREGLGNLHDKNYYTEKAIRDPGSAASYEGAQAYYDHPTSRQEQEQPNRTINELMGHYENVKAVQGQDGVWELRGRLYPIEGDSRKDAVELLEHAADYKKRYPDKDFAGISINGDGEGSQMEYNEFLKEMKPKPSSMEKLKQIEGSNINAITKLTNAFSADVVTAPGAGGAINLKEQQRRRTMKFTEAMKKFFSALENKNTKAAEDAVKSMLQDEEGEAGDKKEIGAGGAKASADSHVKKLLAAMKSVKKEEDESEDAYEGRVKAALKKELEDMMAEDEDAEEDDKDGKDGDDKDDKDPKEDEDKDAEESEDEDETEESEDEDDSKDSDGDDGDHDDAAQDKALVKKMLKKHKELEDEMAELKKGMKQYEAEAKKSKEEAAKAQTELTIKNREALIDKKLAACGYRRSITVLWKPVLEKCKNEKEMDEVVKTLKETAAKANAERFYEFGSVLVEKAPTEDGKNDDLFLKQN